jgi:hypothetical protein
MQDSGAPGSALAQARGVQGADRNPGGGSSAGVHWPRRRASVTFSAARSASCVERIVGSLNDSGTPPPAGIGVKISPSLGTFNPHSRSEERRVSAFDQVSHKGTHGSNLAHRRFRPMSEWPIRPESLGNRYAVRQEFDARRTLLTSPRGPSGCAFDQSAQHRF